MRQSVNSYKRISVTEPKDEAFHIFINNVDSFNGKYILSTLYKQGFEGPQTENVFKENSFDQKCPQPNDGFGSEDKQRSSFLELEPISNTKSKGLQMVSKYKIFGSVTKSTAEKPEELLEVVAENQDQFKSIIANCDCVIYDISLCDSQISKALMTLALIEQEIERHKGSPSREFSRITFILITTAMTWALTPKMDPGDPDPLPFTEADYHRRKPHPNYREHYECEREVQHKGRRFKEKLQTFVVCSGITYGYEENLLSFLFKRAWSNDAYLPIFGSGLNFIPLIHVHDLATVISKIVDTTFEKDHYILAVEQTPTSLRDMVKYISRTLGSGKIQYTQSEEAFLYADVDRYIFDHLTSNILMEPDFIMTQLEIEWKTEMNLVENIEEIVEEFRTHRNLQPLRILVHGPPCSGKTRLTHLLSDYYGLHTISMSTIRDLIDFSFPGKTLSSMFLVGKDPRIGQMKSKLNSKDKVDKSKTSLQVQDSLRDIEGVDEFLYLDIEDSEEDQYQKNMLEEWMKLIPKDFVDNPLVVRLTDEQLLALFKKELTLNCSQNQGFILDAFPRTMQQSLGLFKGEAICNSMTSETSAKSAAKIDLRIIPNHVIVLDAPDEFLLDRMSWVPEELIQNTHYDEIGMVRRLKRYRESNLPESSLLNNFQDTDTDIIEIDVSEFPSEDMSCIFYICTKIIGPPRGFGLTPEEYRELEAIQGYTDKLKKERERLENDLQIQNNRDNLDKQMETRMMKYRLENIKDERIIIPKLEQHRIFMALKVLPTLSKAVVNLVENRPEDPIDYLAFYLFKNNPRGKMYNPRYTRDGELLINEKTCTNR